VNKKLKILIIHYRYFISSGAERYMFNIKDALERNGHKVIPFSIKSQLNKETEFEKFFIEPIGEGKEVYFSQYNKNDRKTVIKGLSRMLYSFEAKDKLEALIEEVRPDIIYVLLYQNKISMSVIDAAKKYKIPVVHRISDFGQVCVNQHFYRKSEICEKCLTGTKANAVFNKCVYNSYVYSFIKVLSLKIQEVLRIKEKIDAFVVPSNFTLSKLQQYGIEREKLFHIPTFFNFSAVSNEQKITYEPFALFVGRIEEEKGVFTLIKAFENTKLNLKIIGFSHSGFDEKLNDYLRNKSHNIEFLGKKDFDQIQDYLSRCAFTIVPSEWYDNLPNTILESFAFRKCVVATDVGSLKELVIANETGLLFPLKDHLALREQANLLISNTVLCEELGSAAYNKLSTEFSEQNHYEKLINLLQSVIAKRHISHNN
jgi:glycosyltransferase involved in cell wall biosynthesis